MWKLNFQISVPGEPYFENLSRGRGTLPENLLRESFLEKHRNCCCCCCCSTRAVVVVVVVVVVLQE